MADYSKAFSGNFPTIAFSSNLDLGYDFSKSLNKTSGSKSMDPFTLGVGLLNAGASIFGADRASKTQANIANAQMAAAADQMRIAGMLGREKLYGEAGQDIANRVAQGAWMPDLELGRQLFARGEELRNFGPAQLALDTDRARRGFSLSQSEDARKASQEANRQKLKETLAEREGQMAGMFGRIAPRDVSTMFV